MVIMIAEPVNINTAAEILRLFLLHENICFFLCLLFFYSFYSPSILEYWRAALPGSAITLKLRSLIMLTGSECIHAPKWTSVLPLIVL